MPEHANQPAIACRETTREFRQGTSRVRALRGVDLEVYPGELTLIVGPSGCGKTTLLSVISGILDPTSGEVMIFNERLSRMTNGRKTEFRRKNVGFVFQLHNLLPALTAAENTAVPLIIAGVSRRRAVQRSRDLLGQMGMADRADALPSQLSGGEQQRVAIARALVHRPRLIVCDEPTSALDAESGKSVMELLRSLAVHPGRAVIVVTHDPRVFEYGDRVATMNDGRVVDINRQSAAANPSTDGGQP
jgi:putative ABC transport system ATP-binding protein